MKRLVTVFITLLLCLLGGAPSGLALDNRTVTITITINRPPSVSSITPADGDAVTQGDIIIVTVNASDPNQDSLLYRFFINGTVKQDWQNSNSWSYQFGADDIGLNRIKAEVTDSMRVASSAEVEIYVFRNTIGLPQ